MEQVLYILTGDSGSGKTTWLTCYCQQVEAAGKSLSGVLAPGVWEDDKKIAIDNVLLPSKQRICVAKRGQKTGSGLIKKWDFSQEAIDKVNDYFQDLKILDYLIIDELGPLELIQEKGLSNAVKQLVDLQFKKAIVVVRPSLLDIAKQKFSMIQDLHILNISDIKKKEFQLL